MQGQGHEAGTVFFFFFSFAPSPLWNVLGVVEGTCGSHPCAAKGQGSGEWHGWALLQGEGGAAAWLPASSQS